MAGSPSQAVESAQEPTRLDPALVTLGVVVVLGAITTMLDMTMVNVALARLITAFDSSVATIQWVSTGYLLAIAMVIPLTGWSVERFGAKTMWVSALAAFLAGSALCGAAWSAGSLIAFRVLQGVGAGMIVPLSMTILAHAAGPRRRGRVMSMVAVPAQIAPLAGPLLGGLIIDGAGWRWIFYLNVPVCGLALLLAWRVLSSGPRSAAAPLDLLGVALLSPGLAALVYGLYRTGSGGAGTASMVVPLAVGVALLSAFAVHAARARIPAILDLHLFTARPFAAAAALNFVTRMSIFGATLLIPLYYQQVHGQTALHTGLLLAPQSVGTLLALPVVGRLTDRIGARPVVLVGIAITVVSALAYTQVGADTNEWLLASALLFWGVGVAASTVPVMAAAYAGLQPALIPRATSAITTIQTVGACFGAAVLAVVLQDRIADPESPTLAAAFAVTFWWVLALSALALIPALFLPRREVPAVTAGRVRQPVLRPAERR
ncbi:MAG: MDR family MFS transporter [Pseudonocardiaceae bacterium]